MLLACSESGAAPLSNVPDHPAYILYDKLCGVSGGLIGTIGSLVGQIAAGASDPFMRHTDAGLLVPYSVTYSAIHTCIFSQSTIVLID